MTARRLSAHRATLTSTYKYREKKGTRVHAAHKVLKEKKEGQDLKDLLAHPDRKDRPELPVHQGTPYWVWILPSHCL